ncbi:ZBTB40 [Mytilus coruscus]|uniref:ZBTB40 n=1 Tax=Mytilus coruscus TaxID=42192 RepID=A0A6J8CYJ5_MYTCO|nr:ZBTB40 [Mytilus coruscus]
MQWSVHQNGPKSVDHAVSVALKYEAFYASRKKQGMPRPVRAQSEIEAEQNETAVAVRKFEQTLEKLTQLMNMLRTVVPFTVYQCQKCPVGFPTAARLSSHEEQVHGPQDVCPFAGCRVSFPRQNPDRMHRHIQRVHPVLRRGSPVGQSVANGKRMKQRPVVGPTMVEAVVDEELPQIEY